MSFYFQTIRDFESARRSELTELKQWQAILMGSQSAAIGSNPSHHIKRHLVITPLRLPPSAIHVQKWATEQQTPDFHSENSSNPKTALQNKHIPSNIIPPTESPPCIECDSTMRSDSENSPATRSDFSPSERSSRGSPPRKTRRLSDALSDHGSGSSSGSGMARLDTNLMDTSIGLSQSMRSHEQTIREEMPNEPAQTYNVEVGSLLFKFTGIILLINFFFKYLKTSQVHYNALLDECLVLNTGR